MIVDAPHRRRRWEMAVLLACGATIAACCGVGDPADWRVEATPTRTAGGLPPTTSGPASDSDRWQTNLPRCALISRSASGPTSAPDRT